MVAVILLFRRFFYRNQDDTPDAYRPSTRYCKELLLRKERVTPCAHGGDQEFGDIANSLEAFQRAIEGGISCIEVDLSITKDDVLVAVHDRDLGRFMKRSVSGPTHRFASRDLLEAGVSTFEEVFELASEYRIKVIVDVKTTSEEKSRVLLDRLVNMLAQRPDNSDEVIIWCKDDDLLKHLHDRTPSYVRIGLTVMDLPGKRDPFRVSNAAYPRMNVVGQHWEFGTQKQVKSLTEKGKRVYLWTSDTPFMMSKSLEQRPEAILTSYPRILRDMMDAWQMHCMDTQKDEI